MNTARGKTYPKNSKESRATKPDAVLPPETEERQPQPKRAMQRSNKTSLREVIAQYENYDALPEGLQAIYDARKDGPYPYYTREDLRQRAHQPSLIGDFIVD